MPPSEANLFHMLRKRYAPPAWVLLPGVRDSTGGAASRTADGIAMGTWPSRGLELLGFEIKSYRSDWLRELKAPGKAEPIARFCDRWYIVAASDETVKLDEVPAGWGLLVANGKRGLVQRKEAPTLTATPVNRRFLAAILRAAQKNLMSAEEIRAAVAEAREQTRALLQEQHKRSTAHLQTELKALQASVASFNDGLGLDYASALRAHYTVDRTREVGAAVKFVLDGGMKNMQRELSQMRDRLRRMALELDALMTPDPPEKMNGAELAEMARRSDG
jgi:hypothetical protein